MTIKSKTDERAAIKMTNSKLDELMIAGFEVTGVVCMIIMTVPRSYCAVKSIQSSPRPRSPNPKTFPS